MFAWMQPCNILERAAGSFVEYYVSSPKVLWVTLRSTRCDKQFPKIKKSTSPEMGSLNGILDGFVNHAKASQQVSRLCESNVLPRFCMQGSQ